MFLCKTFHLVFWEANFSYVAQCFPHLIMNT